MADVAIPEEVRRDISILVRGPIFGGQQAVDEAVKRLRQLPDDNDECIGLLHRALAMLVGGDLTKEGHNDEIWEQYSALVHDIDEYMATCPEKWAGLGHD